MELISVWLIYHKASMSPQSPMNMDGSEFMQGIGVVPATSMKEALERFEHYLREQHMALLDATKCEQYDPKNFSDPTQDNREIIEVASQALESGGIFYACGISSEAMDCMEDEDDG
ncbi:hypothetical protein BTA51_19640 [Hahella sp. CCB-MM4]|uniref:hypothetical protein n=1 Tax=Hahella sp. (strain CCB-MM4) TaxID=1926491 RepID=UPI000B9A9164|nr:hypothetical protein [Hahella sp. CCB-MM4]OZG71836.1 hypothetical protein BTA51_19640 [Hahella sp. CCB-MM4]